MLLAFGLIATVNAEYWRDSDGTVATNDYGECLVDIEGTWDEKDIDAMLKCGDAKKVKTVLRIPSNDMPGGAINFDFDSFELDDKARATIAAINDQVPANAEISVVGFTDAVGTDDYNMELGMRRAVTVASELNFANIGIASAGEQLLVVKTDKPERENRFVEVVAIWDKIVRMDR